MSESPLTLTLSPKGRGDKAQSQWHTPHSPLTLTLSPKRRGDKAQSQWQIRVLLFALLVCLGMTSTGIAAEPAPPANVKAADHPLDGGEQIDVTFDLSPNDTKEAEGELVERYVVQRSPELHGKFEDVALAVPSEDDREEGEMTATVGKNHRGEEYYFRVRAVSPEGETSDWVATSEPAVASREWFMGDRLGLAIITIMICGSVIAFIAIARSGRDLKIRKIAGLEAVDEAVGRATEMGRSCLFVPGVQDIKDIQTVAGLTILARVAQTAAEYDAVVEVPTCRSLVMATARETVQASYMTAGRPDAYQEDRIYYVTDEQFGYVAHLSGMMVREKPAACFYMGSFFAESLILAETGNSIGAIQVAGTAQPAQLPFFVAACDYTLIGEEFFAASAYLSGDPDQLGSLKGQDVGKLLVGCLLLLGCLLATIAEFAEIEVFENALDLLKNRVLS